MPETKATNSRVNATTGRVYVDIGNSNTRHRSGEQLARDLRGRLKRLVGAEYVLLDDLNNGASKPVQIQFYGPDSRRLMAITSDYMERLKRIPGAVDVGLSEPEPARIPQNGNSSSEPTTGAALDGNCRPHDARIFLAWSAARLREFLGPYDCRTRHFQSTSMDAISSW